MCRKEMLEHQKTSSGTTPLDSRPSALILDNARWPPIPLCQMLAVLHNNSICVGALNISQWKAMKEMKRSKESKAMIINGHWVIQTLGIDVSSLREHPQMSVIDWDSDGIQVLSHMLISVYRCACMYLSF